MIRQPNNHCHRLAAGQLAVRGGCPSTWKVVLAGFLPTALIAGGILLGSEDPLGRPPGATNQRNIDRRLTERTDRVDVDLSKRASEFGQRMRDRFFRAPSSAVVPAVNEDAADESAHDKFGSHNNNVSSTRVTQAVGTSASPEDSASQRTSDRTQTGTTRSFVSGSGTKVYTAAPTRADSTSQAVPKRASVWQSPVYLRPKAVSKSAKVPEPVVAESVQARRPVERSVAAPSPQVSLGEFQVEMLRKKFPTSDVKLEWNQTSLVVSGIAADSQQAIQIMAFVRESFLVPVVDRLEVPRVNPRSNR